MPGYQSRRQINVHKITTPVARTSETAALRVNRNLCTAPEYRYEAFK
jgi:hypothetical protein